MSRAVDVKTGPLTGSPLQVVQLLPALFPRFLTHRFQEILINWPLDGVEPGPCVGFWFGGVVLFFRSHVLAFQVKLFSIYSEDTWHGWADGSTGPLLNAGPLTSGGAVHTNGPYG